MDQERMQAMNILAPSVEASQYTIGSTIKFIQINRLINREIKRALETTKTLKTLFEFRRFILSRISKVKFPLRQILKNPYLLKDS